MNTLEEFRHFFLEGYLEYRPNLTIDCAIFGYHNGALNLLLVKNKIFTQWCLPGGYIKKTENLDEAAARITFWRTGIGNLFLKQSRAFGNPGRNNPRAVDDKTLFELTGIRLDEPGWLHGETVTIGYYAITDIVAATPEPDFLSSECCWFNVNELPPLGFDHDEVAQEALATMRMHLYHFPIGKNLLQQKFTLKEIKDFYEVMSGKKLNHSNFPNKLISLGLLEKLDEKRSIGPHRAPAYYKFNEEAYDNALKEGLVLV